ncbi:aminotransferase class I/II-fold pyridoxal phosphate-dependent enzyme [Intrasporangium sp. YIM S08009]|uniref:aminotransferase class I/II-fold pyridoxal phosphate-dependent enzyme n=1 Tax=Intrasporangium zincisolvens TaxID=3080018 RepID=UPI002B051EA5|nr:aminotransferase class I/II-fold pyridoxal phosphate-dependent enzyme [Intrasporangium sp. YIM S08009]
MDEHVVDAGPTPAGPAPGTGQVTPATTSARAARVQAAVPFRAMFDFRMRSGYAERRLENGVVDLTFGDPHEIQRPEFVEALREATVPRDELWFAYKQSEAGAQEAAAASLERVVPLGWTTGDLRMTTGGFGAITVAMKVLADAGEEVVYTLPPWFLYEPLALEAGLVPVKVAALQPTFDLDLDAIASAVTERTRIVIVNSPNNPTGRIYSPATLRALARLLDEASARHGRRIWIVSDEPYNRIVFSGNEFHSPAEFYEQTLICYSYGKTLLAPGQRLGYLAVPPGVAGRDELLEAVDMMQIAAGWLFPNAVMQHATPRLEQLSHDMAGLEAKRDRTLTGLREAGYEVATPEGTFYLWVRSPVPDDEAFVAGLAERGVLVMPGAIFETPGWFRICLTATADSLEAALPHLRAARQLRPG